MAETRTITFKCPQESWNFLKGNTATLEELLCLREILAFFTPKIQCLFLLEKNHQRFYLNSFFSLIFYKKLNQINNFSLFEDGASISESFLSLKSKVESSIFASELSNREVNVQNNDYKRSLESEQSNILTLHSPKFTQTHSNNAQWAREFIAKNKITTANFKTHSAYTSLSKSPRKRAIYDQLNALRKKEVKSFNGQKIRGASNDAVSNISQIFPFLKSKKEVKITRSTITRESVKLALVLGIESAIIFFSHSFYLTLGLSVLWAWTFALLVEGVFSILAGEKDLTLQALKWAIYVISAFTICYGSFVEDSALKKKLDYSNEEVLALQTYIHEQKLKLNRELENKNNFYKKIKAQTIVLNEQIRQLNERMKVYSQSKNQQERKKETSLSILKFKKLGEKASLQEIRPVKIDKKIDLLESSILTASNQLNLAKKKNSVSKILTLENFKSLEIKTYFWMVLMLVFQLISALFIHSISNTATTYMKQRNKNKRKKRVKKLQTPLNALMH